MDISAARPCQHLGRELPHAGHFARSFFLGLGVGHERGGIVLRTLGVLVLALLGLIHASAQEAARVRIGVLAYLGAERSLEEWTPTILALRAGLPGQQVELVPLNHAGLSQALADKRIDFVITNPGHYVELEMAQGVSRIATLQSEIAVASTIIVRSDRRDIASLSDLSGKRLAIVSTQAFGGFQVAWREMQAAGLNPFRHLSLVETGLPMTGVVQAVLTGAADAGVLRACLKEQMEREGKLASDALRVLTAKTPEPSLACAHSSPLYPDWPFAKARHTAPDLARRVATTLLGMAEAQGSPGWTIPVDYTPVHALFRTLMIGPYEALRNPSLTELLRRHWPGLALAGVLLLGFGVHVWRVEQLVRQRTAQLRSEMEARQQAEERDALHLRELDHAARLSLLGEMASGLAHELNQPLSAIMTYADGCAMRLESGKADPADLAQATSRIRAQAERAAKVIQRMRGFAKKREPQHQPLDAAEVIRDVVDLFEGVARRAGTPLVTQIEASLPPIHGDRVQIQQILLNLLQNAVDASGGRGFISLGARLAEDGVEISVSDDGCGLAPDARERLFEPFFTTKAEGLGLGLALCQTLAQAHGGKLMAAANPSGGTIMRLWLPLAQEAA